MKVTFFPVAAFALTVSACTMFGPDRAPPQIPALGRYSVEPQSERLPSADGVAQSIVAGAGPEAEWWRAYRSEALNGLVAEGLRNSPSLAAAQHALEAARQQLRGQLGSTLLPSVDAGFTPTRERALGVPILPQQQTFQYDVFAAQVGASYSFDFFGAAYLSDRALAGQVRQQAFQLEATRRALAANIVKTTINAAALQEQISATERMVELAEQQARQIAARYRSGGAARDDMLTAEQNAADVAAILPSLRAQALAVRHAQAVLLGRTPDRASTPLPLDALRLPGSVPLSVPSELLRQRPDIQAAEAAVQVAADQTGAAIAAKYPSLTLSASYGHGGFDWSTFTSPAGAIWGVGASLTQPLFHGGALEARQREREAGYQAAESQYKQTVLAAFENVADSLAALEQDAVALAQARRADDAAQEMANDLDRRFKLGAVPFYLALSAGQRYESAHVRYIGARAARLADTAALFDAMGDPGATQRPVDEDIAAQLLPE